MALPDDYIRMIEHLATAFTAYHQATGGTAVLVGGAAAAIFTDGDWMSGDFDIVVADDEAFGEAMSGAGFTGEDRVGHMPKGWYHETAPEYGVELVSGQLFDGFSDPDKLTRMILPGGRELVLPSFEDLIADRLGQHGVSSPLDDSLLMQARAILTVAKEVDVDYLRRRIMEDGGDVNLLDQDALARKGASKE